VHPGATASYKIMAWSTKAESQTATVTVSLADAANVESPTFTVCPQPNGDVCTVGDLLTSQSEELVAGVSVQDAAQVGEKVTLTATIKASKATSFHAQATISVVAPSTPTPTPSASDTVPSLPLVPFYVPTSPAGPSGLFPVISPSSSHGTRKADKAQNASGAMMVSATLPIDSRLIGGQLVGLIVLASAITIAVARLSLRTARPHDGNWTGGAST